MRYHLDTDFLIKALSSHGAEWARLRTLTAADDEVELSALVWFEFARGDRSPQQLAVARDCLDAEGVVEFTEQHADRASDHFRRLGRPRRRAFDVAIAAVALERDATLLTGNLRDYSDVDGLRVERVTSD